jgi:hypothetical protein
MGRVLVGAVVGALVGGLLGAWPTFSDATFDLVAPGGAAHVVSLGKILHWFSVIIGVGAGGVIGAIAGATSAQPNIKPIPVWFWISVAVLVITLVGLGALLRLRQTQPRQDEWPAPEPHHQTVPQAPPERNK